MCVAWSPQGDRIVSGHGDDSLCLWSSQGKLLSVQKPQWSDVVHSLAWRHDGSEVVFAALGGPGFGRWDMANNAIEPLTGAEGGEFRGLAFSPDGSRLAALASQGVEIWEWPSRQRLRTFPIAVSSLSPVLWTPDGKSVWVRTQGAALRFEIDSTSDSPAETYAIGGDGALAIDPQTGLLTAVRWSGALTPPGSDAAAATAPPPMAIQAIRHIAFHPTGERIVVAGEPRRVRWFDRHGKLLHEVETPGHPRTVAHSADGALVAVPCDNGMLRLHSDADGALVREWKAHQAPAQAAAFDPTGQRIATCGEDKTVKLWTITGEPLMLEQGEAPRGFNLELLAFSPDGSRLLAASGAGNILLWDNDGRLLSEFQVERQIRAVAWRGDGKKFVLAGSNALRVFSTDGQKEGTITDRVGVPLTCAWTPSHDLIAIDEPGNIRLWSEAGDLRDEWQTSVGGWKLAGFDPTASQVVLSRERGRLESWRLADRRPVFTCILVDDKHFHFDGRGRLQNDNATDISPLTYLVETPDGFRMLNHEEFQKQVYGAP
jgi:WD40 repeat protein